MQAAVSYRWQEKKIQLTKDCAVNMSEWQMTRLLEALRKCNCLYIWIDHMSVPQGDEDPDMQEQLLSRMMAVYSSAGLTIVLRSLELPNSRYHQRGARYPACPCCLLYSSLRCCALLKICRAGE